MALLELIVIDMMNKIKLLIVTMFLSQKIFAQSNETDAHLKSSFNLSKEFNKIYQESNDKGLLSMCIVSATFAKFNIDTLGNVVNLTFEEADGTPPIFKQLLINTLKTTQDNWMPSEINGKKVCSKPFILPLTYRLESGCKNINGNNHTNDALENFLDNVIIANKGPLNCILLPAFHILSMN